MHLGAHRRQETHVDPAVLVGPEAPRQLSRTMHQAWVAFATDGVPAAETLEDWPTIDEGAGRPVMLLDAENRLADQPEAITTRFWASESSPVLGHR